MGKKTKISSTAYRVLFLMQLLNTNDCSIDYLNNTFSNDPNIARTFSKEVILKYIYTLRSAGYNVSKPNPANNHTYKLVKAPLTMRLNEQDIRTLIILEGYVSSLYQERLQKSFRSLVKKLSRYLSEEQITLLNSIRKAQTNELQQLSLKYSQYTSLIQKFEQYCVEDQRVIVKYKFPIGDEEKQIILEPKSIKYDSKDVFISGYNSITGEKQLLHLNNIQEIKQLPVKSRYNYVLSPIIFKLKGRLAKGYRPYEDEKIAGTDPEAGTITIAAYVDDRNMLLQRLLKYGDYCEVIYPKAAREKTISLVQDALKNYDANV
ncbi:MAG: hypothetical protein A2287_08440 [Candidatus Melainabacteria bacterium RIFOXYA12_FULL_32_12]|nr:MAG: hypothetical protein A2255_00935 [Candidatus Melainabacteria bacterium RIFOXYA2_FULL_32_9]OGI24864.1 MAG: hypothetical protein A2287_08440 [Candidatus Melainabacteria bacterium RIFOXYA12_FULL_32_12]